MVYIPTNSADFNIWETGQEYDPDNNDYCDECDSVLNSEPDEVDEEYGDVLFICPECGHENS